MIAPVSYLGDTKRTDNNSWLAGWTNYSVAGELASDDVKWLRAADALYLTPAFISFITLYNEDVQYLIDNHIYTMHIILAVFLSLLTLALAIIFLPRIIMTNKDVKQKQNLLLLIPGEIVVREEDLRYAMTSIMSNEGSIAAGYSKALAKRRAKAAVKADVLAHQEEDLRLQSHAPRPTNSMSAEPESAGTEITGRPDNDTDGPAAGAGDGP